VFPAREPSHTFSDVTLVAICVHPPGDPDASGVRSTLYEIAPDAAVQLTYRLLVEMDVYVGAPGAPGTATPESTAVVTDASDEFPSIPSALDEAGSAGSLAAE
jgi:hypothetical protein